MPYVADAAVAIRGDLSKFKQDLKSADKQTQTLGTRLNSALSPKALIAGAGIGIGIQQVTSFFGDAIQAAGEFEDTVSATGVIFGEEAIPALEKWAEEAHSAFGASEQDALHAANSMAVFGKSAGLVGDDLTDFATDLTQLGGDLASMFGGRTEDAIQAVGSALRGEFEPIRAYGVLLDDATLRQQAFEMGLISTVKNALTPQQRVLAAQASIFAQTGDAQGDFARTSDGLMNTQRDLNAELENVSKEVGEKLLPIMLDFVTFVKNDGIPIMREFIGLLDFGDTKSAEGIPILGEIEGALNDISDSSLRLNDAIFGRETDIAQSAERIGISYMEMHHKVKAEMDELGIDHKTAIDRIVVQQNAAADFSGMISGFGRLPAEAAVAVDGLGNVLPAEVDEGVDAAVERIRQTPGEMATALEEGREAWRLSWEEMLEAGTAELEKAGRIQETLAALDSVELTAALASDDPARQAWAIQTRRDLIAALKIDGYNYGHNLIDTYLQGIRDARPALETESGTMAAQLRGTWAIQSEPTDPNSPLRGITKWGGNYVKTIARGMEDEVGTLGRVSRQLAELMSPRGLTAQGPGMWTKKQNLLAMQGALNKDGSMQAYVERLKRDIAALQLTSYRGPDEPQNLPGAWTKRQNLQALLARVQGMSQPSGPASLAGMSPEQVGTARGANIYNIHMEDRMKPQSIEDVGYGLKRLGDMGVLPGARPVITSHSRSVALANWKAGR